VSPEELERKNLPAFGELVKEGFQAREEENTTFQVPSSKTIFTFIHSQDLTIVSAGEF
jgi:hypothetical protein